MARRSENNQYRFFQNGEKCSRQSQQHREAEIEYAIGSRNGDCTTAAQIRVCKLQTMSHRKPS